MNERFDLAKDSNLRIRMNCTGTSLSWKDHVKVSDRGTNDKEPPSSGLNASPRVPERAVERSFLRANFELNICLCGAESNEIEKSRKWPLRVGLKAVRSVGCVRRGQRTDSDS